MSFDINAPEVQEAIKSAVEAATKPLADKNKELLGELKTARKSQEIKPEDLERIEQERDTLQAQLDKTTKDYKDLVKNSEKITKDFQTESAFTQKLLVENGLSEALVKAGVSNPVHLKAVKSMLQSQVQIVADGDTRVAKVGDKALNDFVTEWATSDEGKYFVSAPANNGGGAQGGAGGQTSKTMTRAAFDAADQNTRASFAKEGGKVVD